MFFSRQSQMSNIEPSARSIRSNAAIVEFHIAGESGLTLPV